MNSFSLVAEKLPEGHPIKVYYEESALIQDLLSELNKSNPAEDFQKYFKIFNQLKNIEKRFARIENQLFPYLEKHGWEGPIDGLWAFHNNLREQINLLNAYNSERNIAEIQDTIPALTHDIEKLLTLEDTRLFPNSMELIAEVDWKNFYMKDAEIGWMLQKKPKPFLATNY
ncbi:hemerythrin domain-containing protein [Mariniflexile jejuense]|uniref:Hemerythrin domain-containing protein n=1 Tax=Mariniflexile jejuense TaxID=1173582 RepID=A0ABW3JIG4_9FLAO